VTFGNPVAISIHGKVDVNTGKGSDFVLSPSGGNDFGADFISVNAQLVASDQPTHVGGKMTVRSATEALPLTVALGIDVDGSVTIVGSKMSDAIRFNENSMIGGNMKLTLRDGNDQADLGSGIGASGSVAIGGKLGVSGGNDDDTLRLGSAGADSGTVAGDVIFSAGAGNDTMRIGTSAVSGKKVVVNGLGGNDTLITVGVLTAPSADLRFQGGNDDDVVDFTVALPQLKSANLNGGRGANTYLPNASPVGYPIKVVNF
jgi:hypothetical protein